MTKLTVTMMNTNNNNSPINSPALSKGGDPSSVVHNNNNHGSIAGGSYHGSAASYNGSTTSSYHSNYNGFNHTTTGAGGSSRGTTPDATMATDTLLFNNSNSNNLNHAPMGEVVGSSNTSNHAPVTDPVEALQQLNVELDRMVHEMNNNGTNGVVDGNNSAFIKAYNASDEMFRDKFKRAFLMAENNVIKAAADRMVAYWETRHDLFGEDRMFLPNDKSGCLQQEDAKSLESGVIQLLPTRDVYGNAVLWYDPSRCDGNKDVYSSESMLRVFWYILHLAMSDHQTRANGYVLLVYPKNCTSPNQIDRNLIAKGTAIIGSIVPLAWKGFHILHPCSSYNKYFPLVKMLSPPSIKDNIAVHFGSEEHVLECMAQYALPKEKLPSDIGGLVELDYTKWLTDRKVEEGVHAFRLVSPPPRRPPSAESVDEVMVDVSAGAPSRSSTTSPGSKAPKTSKTSSTSKPAAGGGPKNKRPGRKGDARMHRAVTLKMEHGDNKSLVDALMEGGFNFEGLSENKPHHEVFDQDGVSLMQRKNQLLRRIRETKKKEKEKKKEGATKAKTKDGDA